MPFIEIEAERRLEFNHIESEWLRGVPFMNSSAQHSPSPDGKIRIYAPTVLIQHLRNIGFSFTEIG
jgi:hypothetical protein